MNWLDFVYSGNDYTCILNRKYLTVDKSTGINAALKTISSIKNSYPEPFNLMCSGGVDSQAMAYAWKISNVPHTIVLFQYINNNGQVFNDHDLKTFKEFSKIHNIQYTIKNFNYFNFLSNIFLDYAKKYDCASPQITSYIKMIEMIGKGTILLSGNFWSSIQNFLPFNYDILALHRFSKVTTDFKLIPFFFLHEPELAFGFNKIEHLSTDQLYDIKFKTYQHNGFPVIPQDQKYSGFEKIKDYFDNKKHLITYKDRLRFLDKPSQRIFDIKYRYMIREEIGKEPEFKVVIT